MQSRTRKRHKLPSTLPSLLAIGLTCCVALALSQYGARMLIAGLYQGQAEAFAKHWQRQGKVPPPEEWSRINQASQRAAQLYPVANAQYLQLLGENWLWRQYEHPIGSQEPDIRQARVAASTAFGEAARLRPLWPGHWAGLARAQAYQMDYSATFQQALASAVHTGRHRPSINLQLAEMALLSWRWLDSDSRQHGERAIRFSVQAHPARLPALAAIAGRAGSQQPLCNSIQDLQLPYAAQQARKRLCPSQTGMN